ncbi:unnamed protein product [Rotaria sp. Silwood2]|nr:unnamed protein product [Rotaria sp. Silwood2]CAF3046780.1 unnamed protein product [Rotaria sp. Silwood2]CAF3294601.1 unnamed protein product [Rotaria sp. Silwood2]CAF3403280.1 unnamed protein product [Rotaria sp. Silwood2]CAF4208536.1 unnamed protein product [Rotaria sp. Silwood2]
MDLSDLPTSSNQINEKQRQTENIANINAYQEHDQQLISLKTQPIEEFRGRFKSEIRPKGAKKRDGTPQVTEKSPVYFADRNGNHFLELLIRPKLIFNKEPFPRDRAQIRASILTIPINGYVYVHPYFKFYQREKSDELSWVNPIYIDLASENGYKDVTETDELLSVILKLPVVMLKKEEVTGKALEPFAFYQDGQVDTKKYTHWDKMNEKFKLNDIRFAFVLRVKNLNNEGYNEYTEQIYISEISTQNRKVKFY